MNIEALIGEYQANFAMTIGKTKRDKITVGNCGKSLLVIPHKQACVYLIPKSELGVSGDNINNSLINSLKLDLEKYDQYIVKDLNGEVSVEDTTEETTDAVEESEKPLDEK